MKLSEYVAALCNALETHDPEGRAIQCSLLPEHKVYRDMISAALKDIFLGKGAFVLDNLFLDSQNLISAYKSLSQAHQKPMTEIEVLGKEKKVKSGKSKLENKDAIKKG